MTDSTIDAIVGVARADATATRMEVDALRNFLRGAIGEAWTKSETMDQVVPCKAAAEILHVSPRTLQLYARRGFIHPVRLGVAGARAIGYTRSSLQAAMAKRS